MTNALGQRSPWYRWLRRAMLLGPAALTVAACGDRPSFSFSDTAPIASGGFPSSSGSPSSGGLATSGTSPVDPCAFDRVAGTAPVFSGQAVTNRLPARPFLYAEVPDADAISLRAGGSLLPPPPTPGTSDNPSLTAVLQAMRAQSFGSEAVLLQAVMNRFKSTRSLWPNPWALRLVDHPGTEHMNPVLVTFKKTALFLRIADGVTSVFDVNNAPVAVDAAAASPDRVAAVFYSYDNRSGTAASCDSGKREVALGNETMVEQIALGTKEILARLDADIDSLDAFFKIARPCTKVDTQGESFRAFTSCTSWAFFDASTELSAYQWSLSTPAELYKPTAQNLASLIQALKDDRFDVDPYVGVPPPPTVTNEGGAGGAGGAGGEGGLGGSP